MTRHGMPRPARRLLGARVLAFSADEALPRWSNKRVTPC